MDFSDFSIDSTSKIKKYFQLVSFVQGRIQSGLLPPGTRLPSVRTLSETIRVSKNTVTKAYSELEKRGCIYSQEKRGYFVGTTHTRTPPARPVVVRAETPEIPTVEYVMRHNLNGGKKSMQEQEITTDFESNLLSAYKTALTTKKSQLYTATAAEGDEAFRMAISSFMRSFYHIDSRPEQIVVGSGKENLLRNIVQLKALCMPPKKTGGGLLHLAEQVSHGTMPTVKPIVAVVEDTEDSIKRIFIDTEIPVRELPVDDMGMNIDFLFTSGATLAYVSPKDIPFGSMEDSSERKSEILDWAEGTSYRHVIEFDSQIGADEDSSFKAADKHGKVIYINSFATFLCPGINASFAILPDDIAADYRQHYRTFDCPLSYLDQIALTEFINSGHLQDYLGSIEQL